MQSTKYTETETDAVRRQWLVAYVQSCLEKRTARRLAAMGIECYLPFRVRFTSGATAANGWTA